MLKFWKTIIYCIRRILWFSLYDFWPKILLFRNHYLWNSKWCFLGGHHILKHWLKNVVWTGEPQPDNPNFKAELNFHTQGMKKLSIIGMVQGISFWNGFYELALRDKHIQVRFGLKLIQVCWVWHFRLWSFQGRDTKLERFLAKNQLYSNEITKFWELE